MALKSLQWVFYNEANADEKIVVQDQKSAQTLAQVLNEHGDVWVMKEEARENANSVQMTQAEKPLVAAQFQALIAQNPAPVTPPVQHQPAPPVAQTAAVVSQQSVPVAQTPVTFHHETPVQQDVHHAPAPAAVHHQPEVASPVQAQIKEPVQATAQPPAPAAVVATVTAPAPTPAPPVMPTLPASQAAASTTPPSMPAPPARAVKPEERRAQKRFKVGLRIILISKNKSFRSISQDVSLGGMKLKNRVPTDFLGGKCIAYISNLDSKENIEMVCQVISDPKDPCRIQFSEPESQQLKRLTKWLIENEPAKKAG